MSYFNLGCLIFLFVGLVFFFYWAFEYGKTYSGSLPMPTKIPPMPMIKPSKPWPRNEQQEECAKCERPCSKYWKELED